jgi:hypothetical protein
MAVERHDVVVTDIKVHFWSMVVLLVKWAIAAIPAVLILYAVAMSCRLRSMPCLARAGIGGVRRPFEFQSGG